VQFELTAAPPFRLDLSVWALRRRPGNRVDRWDGNTYRRTMRIASTFADVAVVQLGPPEAPRLDVTVSTEKAVGRERARSEATTTLRGMFGLDADLQGFYRSAARDPHVRALAERFRGLKPPRFPSLFEGLVNAIACQQLTLTVGIELLNRLSETFGPPAPQGGTGTHAFPEPRDLASAAPDALRVLGFSRRKSEAIVDLAQRVERGSVCLEQLPSLGDAEAIAVLCELRGIGRWSAEYLLLRGLGRLEVFPGDDVGARNNLRRRLGIDEPLGYDEVRRITKRWDPYAGIVYFHFLLAGIEASGWLGDAECGPL
jgi:DNA-3-methyladenine glycosylase II